MNTTHRLQPLIDRARQAMYATALVVAIGSLWTIAWANSVDGVPTAPAAEVLPQNASVQRAAQPSEQP